MLALKRNASPVDYKLCNQTVTVYHWDGGTNYTTSVIHGVALDHRKGLNVDRTGSKDAYSFLLIIPGCTAPVAVGDKVVAGEGEDVTTREGWAALIPSKVPGLCVVKWIDPKYWNGSVVHVEVGG